MPVESPGDPLAPLETLRSCLNLASDGDWLRCLDWLLAALRPDGPHPVLILQGPPGSGKSFAARVLRTFVDPATAPSPPPPLPSAMSSGSPAVTGSSPSITSPGSLPTSPMPSRRLGSGLGATFHEELRGRGAQPVEVSYRRPVLLTVTGKFTCPENIASRALTVDFPAIPPGAQRTEEELRAILNDAFPSILGALLTLLGDALRGSATLTGRAHNFGCRAALLDQKTVLQPLESVPALPATASLAPAPSSIAGSAAPLPLAGSPPPQPSG